MDALVSPDWLAQHLDDPDLRILDCTVNIVTGRSGDAFGVESGRAAWQEAHIPGSDYVDLQADLSKPDAPHFFTRVGAEAFADAMASLGIGEGTRVVLYDNQINMWAARVWWMLRAFGFDDAAVLDGGWRAWIKGDHPTSSTAALRARAEFVARPRSRCFANTDEVEAATRDGAVCIMNALDPANHSGETAEYGRAGRIPGATNVFIGRLIDLETQRFKPLEELRGLVEPNVVPGSERVITYCGGGIAACANAFVLTRLGYRDVGVYDGSLSEWNSDPSRPIERD